MRTGGAILFVGAPLFVVSIGFEASVGWPPADRFSAEVSAFILKAWPSLRWIWRVEGLACVLFGLSALVLLRSRHLDAHWRPATVVWSAVAIGGIMLAVSFALTIGSYGPALLALEESPELFATAFLLGRLAVGGGLLRSPTAGGARAFFVPALLGLALWRAGRQLAPRTS